MNQILIDFYELLKAEENALKQINIIELNEIRSEKEQFLGKLEQTIKERTKLKSLSQELIEKIKQKNQRLNLLYQFGLSLFKIQKDTQYGPRQKAVMRQGFTLKV